MKKAQWKKDPRERAFGKDPREVLNDELTAALKKANDIIHQQNRRIDYMKEQSRSMQDRLSRIYEFRTAYLALRNTGVVMEHGGEFKHLQGEDMDKFFGIEMGPVRTDSLKAMVNEQLNAQFQKALQQSMLYGNSVSHIFYDDKTDALTWLPPQKP